MAANEEGGSLYKNDRKQPETQDNVQQADTFSKHEADSALQTFLKIILQKKAGNAELLNVFEKLIDLTSSSESSIKNADLDSINLVSLLANNIKGYLHILSDDKLLPLLDDINQEVHSFVSSLFCLETGFTYFHDIRSKGIIHVCKLALYMKFAKYAADGFAALYTRPPVIYISGAAPPEFGKQLRTQLGLPQSSVCKVPCNTMFGSPYTMDVAAFDRLMTDDVSCGKTPLILIAYAGTPVTGHTDNLSRLREICTQSGVWLHIEGDSLATLALPSSPPSITPSTSADSFTLDLPDWLASPNIPYCTYYKTSSPALAEQSGLVSKEFIEKLTCLPLWGTLQFIGLEEIRSIMINASDLAQQLSHRLDMVSGIKRLEQSNVVSPVVVFRYKATPALSYSSSSSLDDEEDDLNPVKASRNQQSLLSKNPIDVSPKLCDAFNRLLAKKLAEHNIKIRIEVKQISREGSCLIFNPLQSARACATSRDDIDKFVAQLEQEIIEMDSTLISRSLFEDHFQTVQDVVLIDVSDLPAVGAFQCVPKYWKVTDLSNLSDSKKREANMLNTDMFEKLSQEFHNLYQEKSHIGQVFIQIGLIDESFDVNLFAEKVTEFANELEDNSKFLETISDAVQEKIHEAEVGLQKESEEKFFEEGVLRNVPVFGSVYNWFSPPVKESHGVTGRAFNLASGKLMSTEKTYKYKMQVQNSEETEENEDKSSKEELMDDEISTSETSGTTTEAESLKEIELTPKSHEDELPKELEENGDTTDERREVKESDV